MLLSQNSLLFRERSGLVRTVRGPLPAFQPGLNLALHVPVAAPLPDPVYLRNTQGDPVPDRGLSSPWPFGYQTGQ